MNDKCGILLSTCDQYEDAWLPFFKFLELHWKCCPYTIYLSTETKNFEFPSIKVQTLNCNKKCQWSKRLRLALERVPCEYVFLLLEDFFMLSPVRQDVIDACVDYMDANPKIGMISFERNAVDHGQPKYIFDLFVEKEIGSYYRANCQAGLWRKDVLLSILRDFESPWEFEKYGSRRSNLLDTIFLWQLKNSPPVFDYKWLVSDGYGICAGKWVKGNVELFQKYGIEADFEKMGFYDSAPDESPRDTAIKKVKYYFVHTEKLRKKIKYIVCNVHKLIYWQYENIRFKLRKKTLKKE